MYAVFRSGGKQYRAAKGDVLRLEKIEADEGATVQFDEVLMVGEGADVRVGNPTVSSTTVSGKVLRQGKSRKVSVVKFKRRQNYLRQGSHRQFYTEVEITGITGGAAKQARARTKDKSGAEAAPAARKPAKKKTASKKKASKKAAKKAAKKSAAKRTASKKKTSKKAAGK